VGKIKDCLGRRKKWRGKVKENKRGEKNWPNKEDMDYDVCWVAVIRTVESKVLFQI